MKAAQFDYYKPKTVAEAIDAISTSQGEIKLLGGGQSLGPMLNLRLVRPQLLVDISGLSAYRTIRNRGTIGGSLAHADPAADRPLVLPALVAKIRVIGPSGERSILASEFMKRAFTTKINDNEIIAAIEIPKLSTTARWGYWKFCRKIGEYPDASAMMLLDPEQKRAELWIGALDGAPKSLNNLAKNLALRGISALDDEIYQDELSLIIPELDPIRRQLINTAVKRAVSKGFN